MKRPPTFNIFLSIINKNILHDGSSNLSPNILFWRSIAFLISEKSISVVRSDFSILLIAATSNKIKPQNRKYYSKLAKFSKIMIIYSYKGG